jgi:MOSC domain-containing protein YiiM
MSDLRVLSVNTGAARPLTIESRRFLSAIDKTPVIGPVEVRALGLEGDEQADLNVHGGLDKAVYAYPSEHYPFWQRVRRDHDVAAPDESALPWGFLGENLSIAGLLESDTWIGDELHFPHCVLRVTAPREPCFKFTAVMGVPQAGKLMMQRGCPGFYLAVVQPGTLCAGDPFRVIPGVRGMRVSEAFAAKRIKHLR